MVLKVIRSSTSRHRCLVFIVNNHRKKSRMEINYKRLNDNTLDNIYKKLNKDELVNCIQKVRYFF